MNELELISLQISALFAADARLDDLLSDRKLKTDEYEAWQISHANQRSRLRARRDTLIQTRGGATPILSREQGDRLRDAVRELHAQVVSIEAVEALIGELLTAAEGLKSASAGASSAGPQSLDSAEGRQPKRKVSGASVVLLTISAVAAVAAIAAARNVPDRGRA